MNKISINSAILFSINTIIGSGIFINTGILINLLSINSFLIYPITALIILPIIYSCYKLANKFPGNNLQSIFSSINKKFGKKAAWMYSISKLATASVAIIFGSKIFQEITLINYKFFILLSLFIFIFFNIKNVSFNKNIQKLIFILKIFPVLTLSLYGFIFLTNNNFNFFSNLKISTNISFTNYISSIILVIFSFAGFESIFAIASSVKNSEKNTSKVIISSFLLSLLIYTIYQFIVSQIFLDIPNLYDLSFDTILKLFIEKVKIPYFIKNLLLGSIACSVYGLSYSLLYANSRNIFYIFLEKKLNIKKAVLIAGSIIFFYILILNDKPFYLQQLSALGTIINYILLTFIYYLNSDKNKLKNKIIYLLILLSVIFLLSSIIGNAFKIGYIGYTIYILIYLIGKFII